MADPTTAIDAALSDRPWVGRALRAPVESSASVGVVSIAVQLGACLALGWLIGGTDQGAPYWYYLPILFAGLRFGVPGASVTALIAAALAGPLTPSDIDTGAAQPVSAQVFQGLAFVLVGAGVALIVERAAAQTRRGLARIDLSRRVRRAMELGHITVEYQPIWSTTPQRRAVGAEALVRWLDPELGSVPPGTFVPALEASGDLDELGRWVLDQACKDLAAWREGGVSIGGSFHVAVNVSGGQLDRSFAEHVRSALARYQLDPAALTIELTERTLLEDRANADPVLRELRTMGVRVAIDDFGTGFSSLAYLRDLDVDVLKLDRAFITALGSPDTDAHEIDAAIVGAVVDLGQRLGKEVIVEGVESESQLEALHGLGSPLVQGALLAPAGPAGHIPAIAGTGPPNDPPAAVARDAPIPHRPAANPMGRLLRWLRRDLDLRLAEPAGPGGRPAQMILIVMFVAGSLLTILLVATTDGRNEATTLMVGLCGLPAAGLLHRFRNHIREWMLHALLLAGTAIVLAAMHVDRADTTRAASAAFLIWVTIYASAFFSVRDAVAHGVIAGIGLGVVLYVDPVPQGAGVWIIVMGTAGVAGLVVGRFAGQLRSLAATDPLTKLPNRQAFEALLVAEIDRAERSNTPLAVAIVDLDDFKAINDEQGHLAGDRVLAGLPAQWRTELRSHDVLARYGGDEFVVLLPDCPLDDAEDVLSRMSRSSEPTCSVGVVTLAWGEKPERILARADEALYRAKIHRASVRADRSVPSELAVGGSPRLAHPAGAARF